MSDISLFYPALRILLADFDSVVQQYPDAILKQGVQTAMMLGKAPTPYALTPDTNGITPDIGSDPVSVNAFSLISYHTARLFVMPRPDRYSFKTRAMSESFGGWSKMLQTLEMEIHNLENGTMFSGWQSYFAWLHGVAGLPLGEILAGFELQAPLWTATFTRDGMKVM